MATKKKSVTDNNDGDNTETEKNEAETSSLGITSLEEIASDMAEAAPEVSEHAIAQAAKKAEDTAGIDPSLKDRKGRPFDPNIHPVDERGQPLLTDSGLLRITRPRHSKVNVPDRNKNSKPSNNNADMTAQAMVTGKTAANLTFTVGYMIGGEEWMPRVDKSTGYDEEKFLEKAYADYFLATGKTDLPPGVALSAALICYVAPRFRMPNTQKRVVTWKEKIAVWFAKRKVRKNGAQSNTRNDGKRENDTGKETGDELQA